MPKIDVAPLGDFLREQRRTAQLSLRQLAEQAGVSNPYLSQIERGLRKPSADILQQIAKGLRISAEQLYVRAGILDERSEGELAVEAALLADTVLNERQKRVLLEIYRSFCAEDAARPDGSPGSASPRTPPAKPAAKRTPATKSAVKRVAAQTSAAQTSAAQKSAAQKSATKQSATQKSATAKRSATRSPSRRHEKEPTA